MFGESLLRLLEDAINFIATQENFEVQIAALVLGNLSLQEFVVVKVNLPQVVLDLHSELLLDIPFLIQEQCRLYDVGGCGQIRRLLRGSWHFLKVELGEALGCL